MVTFFGVGYNFWILFGMDVWKMLEDVEAMLDQAAAAAFPDLQKRLKTKASGFALLPFCPVEIHRETQ